MIQNLKICSNGLNSLKKENEKKRKEDREQSEKQNFLALGDLVRSSNKVFKKSKVVFLPAEIRHDEMASRF